MGTQGLRNRAMDCRPAAARGQGVRRALIATSFALLPAVAGCSNFASPGPPPQTAAGSPAATAPPGPATASVAPPLPSQGTTVDSARTSNVDFLNMFRDPPAQTTATPAPAAATGVYPSQSLADLFRSDSPAPAQTTSVPHPPSSYTPTNQPYAAPSAQPASAAPPVPPPATGGIYPSQSLVDLFRSDSAPPAQAANMPHPPSTYTPSDRPYAPPPGQPAYGASVGAAPAGSVPATAPPPPNSDQGAVGGIYPQQSLSDIFAR